MYSNALKYYYVQRCKRFAKVATRQKEIFIRDKKLSKVQAKQLNSLKNNFSFLIKKDPQLELEL